MNARVTNARNLFLLLICLMTSLRAHSEIIQTLIQDMWSPRGSELLYYKVLSASDGRVYRVSVDRGGDLLKLLVAHLESGLPVEITTDGREVIAATTIVPRSMPESLETFLTTPNSGSGPRIPEQGNYQPDVYATEADVNSLYAFLDKRLRSGAECYQRAHWWAYTMWRDRSVRSMKVFLFFTRRYIDEYEYDWWFHVAPFVYLNNEGRVLDPEFTNSPLAFRPWTDHFMESKVDCQFINKYTDYSQHQWAAYCYLRAVPMYYFQPIDVETFDKTGVPMTYFKPDDIKRAKKSLPFFLRDP